MLDKKVFAKTIKRLSDYYPRFELNQEQMGAWYALVSHLDYKEFTTNVQAFIKTNSLPPQSATHLMSGTIKTGWIPSEPAWLDEHIRYRRNKDEQELLVNEKLDTKKLLDSFKEEPL